MFSRALRVALVWVCTSVAVGVNSVDWFISQWTPVVYQLIQVEESPTEELPSEGQFPVELEEIDEFVAHSAQMARRRKATLTGGHFPSRAIYSSSDANRVTSVASAGENRRHNGCGANLRC